MKKYQAFLVFFLVIFLQFKIASSSRFYSSEVSCQRGMIISVNGSSCHETVSVLSELPSETQTPELIPTILALALILILLGFLKLFHKFTKKHFKKKTKK